MGSRVCSSAAWAHRAWVRVLPKIQRNCIMYTVCTRIRSLHGTTSISVPVYISPLIIACIVLPGIQCPKKPPGGPLPTGARSSLFYLHGWLCRHRGAFRWCSAIDQRLPLRLLLFCFICICTYSPCVACVRTDGASCHWLLQRIRAACPARLSFGPWISELSSVLSSLVRSRRDRLRSSALYRRIFWL
ncbi:hypothetical protein C8R47DRAFT_166437 [Mycena vitilis]|nr:hypothetical protein C8R47DRAFT_166437 [Mycena vitilis]